MMTIKNPVSSKLFVFCVWFRCLGDGIDEQDTLDSIWRSKQRAEQYAKLLKRERPDDMIWVEPYGVYK